MKVERLNNEANKIWKRFASESAPDRLLLEIDLFKKLLEIFQAGSSYYFVFNFKTLMFDMVSKEVETILGYHPSEITIPFIMEKLHPEDQPWFLSFENKIVEFFSQLHKEKLMKYKVRYDFRIRKKDGNYLRILHQVIVAEHDENGRAFRTLGIHSDITYLKQEGIPVLSFIGLEGEPSFLDINVNNIFIESKEVLTPREKEIVSLLIEGKLSKEISDILNISKQTVDSHRKNMLRKNNLTNTVELIGKAIRFGWV
jgi:DNA-binding CsgD family transcriptional regulator